MLGSFAPSLLNFRGPLLAELARAGHRVWGLAPDIQGDVAAGLRSLGVEPVEYPVSNAGMNPLADLRTYAALKARFREIRPEVALAYTVKPVVYGLRAAAAADVPRRFALITGLGYSFTGGGRSVLRAVVRRLYRTALSRTHGAFFQNPDDERCFREEHLLPKSCASHVLAGSGVDLDHYRASGPPPERPSFLLMARLLGDKGIREYHQAAVALKARHPQTSFRLVGPPFDHPDALRHDEIEAWKREGVLEMPGESKDVRPDLERCSVYVLPSYREGMPRSVLEAMAMGRAIVTTDAPGCREPVIQGENGFLVPPRDPVALEKAMEKFILDPELAVRMGRRSVEIAREKFDVRKVNAVMMREMGLLA